MKGEDYDLLREKDVLRFCVGLFVLDKQFNCCSCKKVKTVSVQWSNDHS
jgi:hypothetical protein